MPRNIEYLLERYIQENNLDQFILTCALFNGFYPPNELLKSYGGGYGPDNWILSKEQLMKYKLSMEIELNELLSPTEMDVEKLKEKIELFYGSELDNYTSYLNDYNEELDLLNNMHKRVMLLPINNENQKKFKTNLQPYFSFRKKELDEQYKKLLIKPQRETLKQVKKRLIDDKITELKSQLKHRKLQLLFDDDFFNEIKRDWLSA